MNPLEVEAIAARIAAGIGAPVTASRDGSGTACLEMAVAHWPAAARFVRDHEGMDFLDWLSAVDEPDADPAGVQIVLHVVDSRSGGGAGQSLLRRMLLRTRVPDVGGGLASLTGVWPGVAWHERETFEMFGVPFHGFDDGAGTELLPLLLPDGFEGTPLRKSFILAARVSKPWPGAKEPGESDAHAAPSRRKTLPPGVPDPAIWPMVGAQDPGDQDPGAAAT